MPRDSIVRLEGKKGEKPYFKVNIYLAMGRPPPPVRPHTCGSSAGMAGSPVGPGSSGAGIWFESSPVRRGPDGRIAKMHLNCFGMVCLNAKQTAEPSFPFPPGKMCLRPEGLVF